MKNTDFVSLWQGRRGDMTAASAIASRMQLESFGLTVRDSLRGFPTVWMPDGLVIANVPVCTACGKSWAALPAKPVLASGGRYVEKAGKKQYVAVLKSVDRATADRWSAAIVE